MFGVFKTNSRKFIVNQSHPLTRQFSQNIKNDFVIDESIHAGYTASDFNQDGLEITFKINSVSFHLKLLGRHNMENAVAACAVADQLGVELRVAAEALEHYEGIYRRHQVLGKKKGVWMIDDYAHNPVKC